MNENRRGFLKKAGRAALGMGCGFPLLSAGCNAYHHGSEHDETPSDPNQMTMIVDVQKCLKKEVRDACVEACDHAHNFPSSEDPERKIKWIWSDEYKHAFPDQTHAHVSKEMKDLPVLVLCNHCSSPACVKVCPTGATWKRPQDGIVMMDMHRCIGCRYCMVACPYGARSFNWWNGRANIEGDPPSQYPVRSKGVVEKCTFCADKIRVGLRPACVEAAEKVTGAEGALTFGKMSDPEIVKILKENRTVGRRLGMGTGPNVFYIV